MTGVPQAYQDERPRPVAYQPIALVDLLDRLLAGGVVITGEVSCCGSSWSGRRCAGWTTGT